MSAFVRPFYTVHYAAAATLPSEVGFLTLNFFPYVSVCYLKDILFTRKHALIDMSIDALREIIFNSVSSKTRVLKC